MKILSAAVIVTGMLLSSEAFPASKSHKETKQDKQFQADYLKHVDVANAALRDFINAPCDSLEDKAKNLDDAVKAVHTGMKSIPDNEDELVQAFQEEVYYGLTVLEDGFVTSKIKECKIQLPDDSTSSPTNTKS
jgi:hypothetical protein